MLKRLALCFAVLTSPAAAQDTCRTIEHLGDSYDVCTTTEASRIDLWRADASGQIYGDFSAIETLLGEKDQTLSFAMNGGMYHDDRRAVGYYLDIHGLQTPLMTRDRPGNFGLLPNGVFCVANGIASITESRTIRDAPKDCRIATQSGPMLVINGALHPKFLPDSTSRKWRNGVGVSADGTVHFAISNGAVRFHDFATLFRDVLQNPNALFLDGSISRFHAPALGRSDSGVQMGPILGVISKGS